MTPTIGGIILVGMILAMIEHDEDCPDHGVDCACMDQWIARLRNATTLSNGEAIKTQMRIDYVMRKATEYRRL